MRMKYGIRILIFSIIWACTVQAASVDALLSDWAQKADLSEQRDREPPKDNQGIR